MSNPNKVLANVAKRPWTLEYSTLDPLEARRIADRLVAEGWDVKRTTARMGPRGPLGWKVERVWKREREDTFPMAR